MFVTTVGRCENQFCIYWEKDYTCWLDEIELTPLGNACERPRCGKQRAGVGAAVGDDKAAWLPPGDSHLGRISGRAGHRKRENLQQTARALRTCGRQSAGAGGCLIARPYAGLWRRRFGPVAGGALSLPRRGRE